MALLPRELRQVLDRTVVEARSVAEAAARAALSTLAVDRDKPFDQLSEADRALRRALRAKERQLGSYEALVSEIAYQHWHRMLFARFLAENQLLMHPEVGVTVSLEEVADLAREEGEPDLWVLAARYAARMLPAIFREGDPELELRFAPEGRRRLEELLASLPPLVFTSDDGLGWVYQFWQSAKKKEVNRSGDRIGAAELPAVTQLFTENYMVRFLLENSLGAWWAGRHPDSPLLDRFAYLRFKEDRTLAAGTFEGWPDTVAEVTLMDPCCGSGHFLTVAFEMLTAMRMEEEGLSTAEAGDAVIEQNLFGLEIDPRCTQIAAFALALASWRGSGYRELPGPNIACSGIGVEGQLSEWKKLAGSDQHLENALTALHEQFRNSPELGSLIDPRRATEEGHLFSVEYNRVAPLLEELLSHEEDPETQVAGWAAAGIVRAAALLARTYTLVATNVPYLARGKQADTLKDFCERHHLAAKADLATAMVERALGLTAPSGACAAVAPQNWLTQVVYRQFRLRLLRERRLSLVFRLGEGGFASSAAAGAFVALYMVENGAPTAADVTLVADLVDVESPDAKEIALRQGDFSFIQQLTQLSNPDARIVLGNAAIGPTLAEFASCFQGIKTGDDGRFRRCFWEVAQLGRRWTAFQTSVEVTAEFGGLTDIVDWDNGNGPMAKSSGARIQGRKAVGRGGVMVSQMRGLPVALYLGELFDTNASPIVPHRPEALTAIWAYCLSTEYATAVRSIEQALKVSNATLVKVPFDLERWTKVAEDLYPDGLPEPHSKDPTQWLFKGNPIDATGPLQVAVARLLGYRWPNQEPDAVDDLADADGAVPIPPIAGEASAAERLRVLLERAWGGVWSPTQLAELLSQAGNSGMDLETWLRDRFFASHAKLFHNRPFIWHIWDGRKDGFSVLVNYHRLDRQLLDRVTHTLLGNWIETQREHVRAELPGGEGRLSAAQDLQSKLELIAEGEPPYDIYVRWKPLHEQPIGWDPDLNDGARLNIRPFVTAGVLRSKFTINWNKDRGKDPGGSERLNDLHLTRAEKQSSREKAGK